MAYVIARILLGIYFFLYHRLSVFGKENIPKAPVILAANHCSYLDPPILGVSFPRRLRSIAWEGLFKNPVFAWVIRALGAVPVSHENKESAAGLLRQVLSFLEEGSDVLIFPEGQRTDNGRLKELEGGVALLSLRTGAPILPVWIQGTYRAMSISMSFPRPIKLRVFYGEAIDPKTFPKEMSDKERRVLLMQRLKGALEEMERLYGDPFTPAEKTV